MGRWLRPSQRARSVRQSNRIPRLGDRKHCGRVSVLQPLRTVENRHLTLIEPTTVKRVRRLLPRNCFRSHVIIKRQFDLLFDCIDLLVFINYTTMLFLLSIR